MTGSGDIGDTTVEQLLITSCMAPIADRFVQALADYLSRRMGIATRFVDDISWQEREKWPDEGCVHLCWLCGLPYIWKTHDAMIELLAAPVMQGSRYEQRPIYFSDVVVHRDSPFLSFAQLRGASWAYNEPRSHSGHLLTRYYLETRGEGGPEGYFGAVIAAGSHQRALELILACRAQHVTPVARDAPAASQAAQGRTAAGEIS